MSYKQIILPYRDTDNGRRMEMRVNLLSHRPGFGRMRGAWNSTDAYQINDIAVTSDAKRWFALAINTNVTPVEGATWTAANNYDFVQADQTQVLILDQPYRLLLDKGATPLSQFISRQEGKLSATSRDFNFYDRFFYSGTDGAGTATGLVDLTATSYKTLLTMMFPDATALNTIFTARYKLATVGSYSAGTTYGPADVVPFGNDVWELGTDAPATLTGYAPGVEDDTHWVRARELVSIGDCKVQLNTAVDREVLAERTPQALQIQSVKVTVDTGFSRASNYAVRDLFPIISESDFVNASPLSMYGGLVITTGNTITNHTLQAYELQYTGNGYNYISDTHVKIANETSNANLHGITHKTFLEKIFSVLGISFDAINDFTTGLTFWSDITNITDPTHPYFDSVQVTDTGTGMLDRIVEIYEWLVGSDPRCDLHVQQLKSPISYDWNEPLSTVLNDLARKYICFFRSEIDQVNKRSRLRLINIRSLNLQAGTTLTANAAIGATTVQVASLTNLKQGQSYPFFAQINTGSGPIQTVECVSDDGVNTVTVTLLDTSIAWSSGANIQSVETMPSDWRLVDSKRDQQVVSASHVEVSNTGFDDAVACHKLGTSMSGEPMKIEVNRQAKKIGNINTYTADLSDIIPNASLDQGNQESCWKTYSGGSTGRGQQIYADDATITFISGTTTSGGYSFRLYHVHSPSIDFGTEVTADIGLPDLYHSGSLGKDRQDVMLFDNGAVGLIENKIDRNTVQVAVEDDTSSIIAPTGTNKKILVGYTSGISNSGAAVHHWVFDIAASDGSNVIATSQDFTGTDIYGDHCVGQQFVMPGRGVFTIQSASFAAGVGTLKLDRPIEIGGTGLEGRLGGPQINSDGWIIGSYLYYYNTSDKRFLPAVYNVDTFGPYTPNLWRDANGSSPNYWYGLYTISRIQFNPPQDSSGNLIPPDDNHGNALYTYAQVYCAQNIGNFVQLTRTYSGLEGNDGTLTGVKLLDSFSEYNSGANRNFMFIGLEQDELEFQTQPGQSRVTCLEWPDFSAPLDTVNYPVWVLGNGAASGNASSIGGGGGSGASSGGAITIAGKDPWGSKNTTTQVNAGRNDDVDFSAGSIAVLGSIASAATISGIRATANTFRVGLTIVNTTGYALTIANNDTTNSLPGNQVLTGTGTDAIVPNNGIAILNYDGTTNVWRILVIYPNSSTRGGWASTLCATHVLSLGDNNDVDFSDGNIAMLGTLSGAWSITGIVGPGAGNFRDGLTVACSGLSGTGFTLKNLSTLSTGNNRIITGTGGDIYVGPGQSITLVYDGYVNNKWVVIGTSGNNGYVTSVDVSGGTTGLTTSGGPVTSSGTITIAGTLAATNGGTGKTSLTANNIIAGNGTSPVQQIAPGASGTVLTSNGTGVLPSFQAGGGGGGGVINITQEIPSGSINSSNTSFTLINGPIVLWLALNGLLQQAGVGNDFTLSGSTITFSTAPTSGDTLQAFYSY